MPTKEGSKIIPAGDRFGWNGGPMQLTLFPQERQFPMTLSNDLTPKDVIGLATVSEAAEYLRYSKNHINALCRAGSIPYVQMGRKRFIPWDHLKELRNGTKRFGT